MELTVFEKSGHLYTDSREVAAMVGKSHKKLLRDIRTYIDHFNQSKIGPVDFFTEGTYKDQKGEVRPCYNITRKGCDLIAHKLTGVKGTVFSVAYINRFYDMERLLLERKSSQWKTARLEGKKTRRIETDAVKAFVEYAMANGSKSAEKYYIHFTKLANESAGVNERDTASVDKLLDLRVAEQIIANAIKTELDADTEYHEAFRRIKKRLQQTAVIVFAPKLLQTTTNVS